MNGQELLKYENWVVVGDVLNIEKYANTILNELKEAGYNVVGVNPKDDSGKAYKDLKSVPYRIDVIDLCINTTKGINFVKEAKELNINKILIQPGARSMEIIDFCNDNEIYAVQSCALVELSHRK
jgi:uncharacterized protein